MLLILDYCAELILLQFVPLTLFLQCEIFLEVGLSFRKSIEDIKQVHFLVDLLADILLSVLFSIDSPIEEVHKGDDEFVLSERDAEIEGVHLLLEVGCGFEGV